MGFGQPISAQMLSELVANGWELYHVAEDFVENHNVAARHRDRARRRRSWRIHPFGVMKGASTCPTMKPSADIPAAESPDTSLGHRQQLPRDEEKGAQP